MHASGGFNNLKLFFAGGANNNLESCLFGGPKNNFGIWLFDGAASCEILENRRLFAHPTVMLGI